LLFVLSNLVLSIVYYHRVLPRTQLGTLSVGGRSINSLQHSTAANIAPAKVTLQHGTTKATYSTTSLGVAIDIAASVKQLDTSWHWLPVFSLFTTHYAPIIAHVNHQNLATTTNTLSQQFHQPALGRHVGLNGTTFVVKPAINGYELNRATLLPTILDAVQHGKNTVAIPTTITVARASNENELKSELPKLQQQLDTAISFKYHDQTIHTSAIDRGHWFAASGITMVPSAEAAKPYLAQLAQQLGITIANPDDLAAAAAYALSQADVRTFGVVAADNNTAVRTYCTATKDVDVGILAGLDNTLAMTYNDVRGWNDNGKIAFRHVASGCQYTVWMTAAADMTSFGAICDNYYNCQVGTDVILNYDRWTSATPPWSNAGGTIQDYHTLMINHETGHRLGFRDNPTCPGASGPAPVMMQQSIDLKGCVFNIWPRPAEFDQLNQMLGIGQTTSVTNLQ
jgi:hypothetical protein